MFSGSLWGCLIGVSGHVHGDGVRWHLVRPLGWLNLNTGRSRFHSWTQSCPLLVLLRNKTSWSKFLDCKLSGAGINISLYPYLYSESRFDPCALLGCQCNGNDLIDCNGEMDNTIQQEGNLLMIYVLWHLHWKFGWSNNLVLPLTQEFYMCTSLSASQLMWCPFWCGAKVMAECHSSS